MPESVKLPVVGAVSRRGLLIGGGAAALVVGLVWYRKRQADQAAAAAGVDPNADDLGAGLDALDDGSGSGVAGGGAGGAGNGSTPVDQVTTNAQWSALVIQSLGGVVDPSLLSQAIGLYLTGSAVTSDQELIIDQAIAFAGYPPVAGPAGYPPAIRRTGASGGQTDGRQGPPYPFDGTPDNPSFRVTPMSNVDGWITALQRHGVHTSWSQVEALNGGPKHLPGTIWGNIRNGGDGKSSSNYFVNAATYRLPSQTTWFK